MEKLQLAYGARPEQGSPERTNCRGNAMERASDFAVRLLMLNWRVTPGVPVACGPYWASFRSICSPVSSVVYSPVSGTVYVVRIGAPPIVLRTGITRVPVEGAVAGVNATITLQVAEGASVPQFVLALKLKGAVAGGEAI